MCGQLKTVQGMRQFNLRGLVKVRGEWLLASTSHNLLKLFRSRNRATRAKIGARKNLAMALAAG